MSATASGATSWISPGRPPGRAKTMTSSFLSLGTATKRRREAGSNREVRASELVGVLFVEIMSAADQEDLPLPRLPPSRVSDLDDQHDIFDNDHHDAWCE